MDWYSLKLKFSYLYSCEIPRFNIYEYFSAFIFTLNIEKENISQKLYLTLLWVCFDIFYLIQ